MKASLRLRHLMLIGLTGIASATITEPASAQEPTTPKPTLANGDRGKCSQLLDETTEGVDPVLAQELLTFEQTTGLRADALMIENGSRYGITDQDSLRDFITGRSTSCPTEPADVVVAVTKDPREFVTRVQGDACSEYWENARDDSIDAFRSDLQNGALSRQRAMAQNLAAIRTAQVDGDRTIGTCDQSNVPWAWIIGGAAVVGVGALAYYALRDPRGRGYGGYGGGRSSGGDFYYFGGSSGSSGGGFDFGGFSDGGGSYRNGLSLALI